MAYTHSRLPVDGRAMPVFEIINGIGDTFIRQDSTVKSDAATFTIEVGEPTSLEPATDDGTYKIYIPATVTITQIVGANTETLGEDTVFGLSWDKFSSSQYGGFPGACDRGRITSLSGSFIARVRISEWFCDDAAEENATPGLNNFAVATNIQTGRDVVVLNRLNGAGPQFVCLLNNTDERYASVSVPIAVEMTVDNAVIGKVIRKYTHDDGHDYVDIRFKL